jgi:hypothetical protein
VTARASLLLLALSLAAGLTLAAMVLARRTTGAAPTRGTAAGAVTFTSARTAGDALPPPARALAVSSRPAGVSDQLFEGAWLTSRSRRLRAMEGTWPASLYAVPTSRGRLCQVLLVSSARRVDRPVASGGCVTNFSGSTPIGLIVFRPAAARGPAIVAGIVPNRVTAIHLRVGRTSYRAPIRNHAYLYELAGRAARLEAVVVTYVDGATRTLALPGARPVK